jgi:transcriptional regulator with XRE-family HTH domain
MSDDIDLAAWVNRLVTARQAHGLTQTAVAKRAGRCHKVVRLYDANNEQERAAMLQAHVAFNCVADPFLDILVSVAS